MGDTVGGDFRVLKRLSEGGMGAVFVAEQLSTGKRRALKTMNPDLARDPRFRERFVLEARAGSRIDSEHIVEVVAAGIDERTGAPWLAMELLDGGDLASVVEARGPLPLAEVVEALHQLAHALSKAHAAGIVHRDLKPENIFIARPRRDGVPFTLKVLDFGIAKLVSDAGDARITGSLGTPLWMAPEQAELGAPIGPAADIWPLGLIAYYALTACSYWRAADSGRSITALMREVLLDPIDPPSTRGRLGLPPGFDAWFLRCVARDPSARFPSARAAIDAFTALVHGPHGGSGVPVSPIAATQSAPPTQPAPVTMPTPRATIVMPTPPRPMKQVAPAGGRLPWFAKLALILLPILMVGPPGYEMARSYLHLREVDRQIREMREGTPEDKARLARVNRLMKQRTPELRLAEAAIPVEDDNPWIGRETALVTLVIFCGWRDDACAELSKAADERLGNPDSHLRVVYKHAVPRTDLEGRVAAEALQGIFEAGGPTAFRKARDLVLSHRGEITRANLVRWAREAGVLDPDELGRRLDAGRWAPVVRRDSDLAARFRFSRSQAYANCQRGVSTLDIDLEEDRQRRTLLAADDMRNSDDPSAFAWMMFSPYRDACAAAAKSERGIFSDTNLSPKVVRSPYASDASEEAAREVVVRHIATRTQGPSKSAKPAPEAAVVDMTFTRGTDDATLTASVVQIVRTKKAGTAAVVQTLHLVRADGTWRVDSSEEPRRQSAQTWREHAVGALLATPVVADMALAKPTRAESDAGCIARVATVDYCFEEECQVSISCHAGTSLQTIGDIRFEPKSCRLTTQLGKSSDERAPAVFPAADLAALCSGHGALAQGAPQKP